jgi:hypothetical protein
MFFLFILKIDFSMTSFGIDHGASPTFDPLKMSVLLMLFDCTLDPFLDLSGLDLLLPLLMDFF